MGWAAPIRSQWSQANRFPIEKKKKKKELGAFIDWRYAQNLTAVTIISIQ